MTDQQNKIPISEIFGPTIQGEGDLIGHPTVFVRIGGCTYNCSFCDTLYAVLEQYRKDWTLMSSSEILKVIKTLSGNEPILVTFSGGNPAMQDLSEIIRLGSYEGYTFCAETQGDLYKEWFNDLDQLILSPKPPSSLMKTDYNKLDYIITMMTRPEKVCLKIVVSDKRDFDYAINIFQRYPSITKKYISPCNISPGDPDLDSIYDKMRYITDLMLENKIYDVCLTPQMHVLMYGNERGK